MTKKTLQKNEETEEVIGFIFLPNAMRHINMDQITSVSASPPRAIKENEYAALFKPTDRKKKKVRTVTEWVCHIKMSSGENIVLNGEEARVFLDLIEQISTPLNVPVKEEEKDEEKS